MTRAESAAPRALGREAPAFLKPSGTTVLLTIRRGQLVQQLKIRLKDLL
jgi:hypothetical protein